MQEAVGVKVVIVRHQIVHTGFDGREGHGYIGHIAYQSGVSLHLFGARVRGQFEPTPCQEELQCVFPTAAFGFRPPQHLDHCLRRQDQLEVATDGITQELKEPPWLQHPRDENVGVGHDAPGLFIHANIALRKPDA